MPKNKGEKVLRTRLPLELECEMFKFVKPQTQRKLIWRMGRGIYGMFGQKLLAKVWDCFKIRNICSLSVSEF
jgi:hypothetical protein